jgi:hypothetical protein
MKRTFNRFALAALVAAALCAVGATAASALVSGHFVSEVSQTQLKGVESGAERTEFRFSGFAAYQCEETSYVGMVSATTVQEVTITPAYAKCVRTIEGEDEKVEVKTNGCHYIVKIGPESEEVHSTAFLTCPAGKKIEITSSFCTIKFGPQLVTGIDYTTATEFSKHSITADLTIKGITMEVHAGMCQFLTPTNSTAGELFGSVKVNAINWQTGQPVGITATGGPGPQKVRSEAAHTTLAGTQSAENVYTFGILMGSAKCANTSVLGTTSALAVEEVTLSGAYGGCKGLERDVTVDMNGCSYVLKFPWFGSTASFAIECPAEKSIETTYDSFPGGCTVVIGAQNASGNVDVKNEGAGTSRDILLTWTLSGLKYKRNGCEVGGEASNGTYAGSVTLKGYDTAEGPIGIWYG